MTDIVNFVPLTAKVEIRGHKISLSGIEFDELGALLHRFPKFREIKSLNAAELVRVMDRETMAAVIATAAGHAGNEKAEKSFANLSPGERIKMISKIVELTMPDGIGPFLDLAQMLQPPKNLVDQAAAPGGAKIVVRSRASSKRPAS